MKKFKITVEGTHYIVQDFEIDADYLDDAIEEAYRQFRCDYPQVDECQIEECKEIEGD